VQPTPSRFELTEIGVMQDRVHLFAHLLVDGRDHRLDARDGVRTDQLRVSQRLLREGPDRLLDIRLHPIGLRLELLLQEFSEIVALVRDPCEGALALDVVLCHGMCSLVVRLGPTLGRQASGSN
jgi:hypothetical protein